MTHKAIAFGDHEFDLEVQVGERFEEAAENPFEALMAIGGSRRKTIILVIHAIRGEIEIATIEPT